MAAHQAPLSLGFSRQEYWSGLPFPSPMHACMLSCFSCVQLCVTPQTAAHQAPLSTGFSRQEYWSGLLFPSPNPLIRSWYFSEPVCLGCDCHKYCLAFTHTPSVRKSTGPGVVYFFPSLQGLEGGGVWVFSLRSVSVLEKPSGFDFGKEGEGGMFQENSIETCILSRVKQTTSPSWMHETSARAWCTGKTQKDHVEREVGVGIGMGNTCKSMADSFECMTRPATVL